MFQGTSPIQNDLLARHFQKSFADDENATEVDRAFNFSLIACCKVGFPGLCFFQLYSLQPEWALGGQGVGN